MATFAELAGASLASKFDSHSLVPTLTGRGTQAQHEYLYWEFYERGVRQAVLLEGRWKGIQILGQPAAFELYDLRTDLGEETNLATRNPEIVARITQNMSAAHEDNAYWSFSSAKSSPLSKKQKQQR